jgi:DNA repair protein RecO (recombination protein O)
MSRNLRYSALILRSRQSGESNREVWLLTAEAGVVRVTVFGGPKSKLRAYASPFHSGQAWVYHEPVKDTRKLSDFDVQSWRPGLREMYERVTAADAIAETILASHGGGGNWAGALSLAEAALDALALANGETCERIVVWFMWQWIDFLGLLPLFDNCSVCGEPVEPGAMLMFVPREGALVCMGCLGEGQGSSFGAGLVQAGPGCRHWLETVRPLSPSLLSRYTLDGKSFREAQALTTAILAEALGKRLGSWQYN